VLGAALFSVLLHMKHIFVYAAPAVAAHLLVGDGRGGGGEGGGGRRGPGCGA